MANTSSGSLGLAALDFDTNKASLAGFLKSQSVLRDYNYAGSNMNVELSVLSYNTYLYAFYLNMVFAEMFLDSAQKLDSVVSRAKELNYLPRSYQSSEVSVSFSANTLGTNVPFVIPRGTIFSGTNANGTFLFTTDETTTYVSGNSTYSFANLNLYEGTYFNDSFVIDYEQNNQQFVLSNPSIDLSSLVVTTIENGTNTVFSQATTLFGLDSSSNIYFVQAAQKGQYEILFGDGLFGRVPINGATVVANYRVSRGTDADGVSSIKCSQDLGAVNGGKAVISQLTIAANSAGAANSEGIESIRFSAPRYYAAQQRAVSTDDYESLILAAFGGQISGVRSYGGEQLPQKQYGRVVISLKPSTGTVAPDYLKNEIVNYLSTRIVVSGRIIVTDPDYTYIGVTSVVQANLQATVNTPSEIQNEVLTAIQSFDTTNLENFGGDFRYSPFLSAIDKSDPAIVSNQTSVTLIKRIAPALNYATSYTLNFNNPVAVLPPLPGQSPMTAPPVITSTFMVFIDQNNISYPFAQIADDNFGNLYVYTYVNNIKTVVNNSIGSVDYSTGLVNINKLKVADYYGAYIGIVMTPQNDDAIVSTNQVLSIDVSGQTPGIGAGTEVNVRVVAANT